MSNWIKLKTQDGHVLDTYFAQPATSPIGAIVLVQEIFGVNAHIRSVADGYANDGFVVIVPALFDRIERGVELKYEGDDLKRAFGLYQKLNPETALLDIAASYDQVRNLGKGIAVIGFCYGGFMSWLTATRGEKLKMQPSCCVGYYPGGIGAVGSENPSCPVMLHFGAKDSHIGPDQVEAVRRAHPEVEIFVYKEAEHGFNCDARASYHPASAALARERTVAFLKTHVA